MANWFVSTSGSNSTGTGAYNNPWATLAKALTAGSGVSAGDTVYIEPGNYPNTAATAGLSGGSGSPVTIKGDVDGAGFRAAGAASPRTGEVRLTPHATGTTQCGTTSTINLNAKSYLTFRNLTIVGSRASSGAAITDTASPSIGITLQDCALVAPIAAALQFNVAADTTVNHLIDRCLFVTNGNGITVQATVSSVGEYNLGITIQNCQLLNTQGYFVQLNPSGTPAANKMGYGISIQGCTGMGDNGFAAYSSASVAFTNTPMTVKNCAIFAYKPFVAGLAGYIAEDYNVTQTGGTYMNNGTPGAHSVGSSPQQYAPLLHFGQEIIWGGQPRPFMTPTAGSPYLNYGDGTAPGYDMTGRNRPEGS